MITKNRVLTVVAGMVLASSMSMQAICWRNAGYAAACFASAWAVNRVATAPKAPSTTMIKPAVVSTPALASTSVAPTAGTASNQAATTAVAGGTADAATRAKLAAVPAASVAVAKR